MSQRREQVIERLPASDAVLGRLENWYHVPILAALVSFMAWIRVRNWETFLVDGRVLFSGNDAWYHYRQVSYTVRNWPETMPFDPWTSFPTGTSVGQFGTLFDQLIATAALVVGLGSPTERTISLALLFAPAALGVLTVIPIYFVGRRLGDRPGGVVAVAILALAPGDFLRRSIVGFSDHHVAEAFFQALAVLAILVALAVARQEKPVSEQLLDRDLDGLRRPIGWAALAGVTIALYIWAWPPAILLIGILGAYFTLALTTDYLAGDSPEHSALVGAVALAVTGVLSLVPLTTLSFSPTNFSLLQPVLAFAVAAGCVFMAWLARLFDAKGLPRLGYPAVVAAGIVGVFALLAAVAPDLAALIRSQFLRVAGFGTSATAQTVGEAQPIPLGEASATFTYYFGLAYLTAGAAVAVICWRLATDRDDRRAELLFVVTWTAFLVAATLTQQRFNYYLLLAVATLNAFLVGWVIRLVGVGDGSENASASGDRSGRRAGSGDTAGTRWGGLQTYQVLTIAAALLLVTAPFVVRGQYPTAGERADSSASPGEVAAWEGSLEWMRESTPREGTYGGADNPMGYYGTYERTDDYNYPKGSYGVISWWDYGHFITSIGQRIPVANPFQQNAIEAANFLLATNESHANELLPTDQGGQEVRYVMLDWKLADPSSNKFFAPIVFYDDRPLSEGDIYSRLYDRENQRQVATIQRQRYYESMRVRLYQFHGSSASPQPIVIDYTGEQTVQAGGVGERRYIFPPQSENGTQRIVRQFENTSAARAFVERDGSAQIGGIQGVPSEYVPALEHYRLVHASATTSSQARAPWVKTFARVPGAEIEGTGPPNATVTASVEMRMPNAGETFTYTQRARTDSEGRFTMTVPYSTTGYEQWGTAEGYTDVNVRATGPYTFTAGERNGTAATGTNATTANATNTTSEGNATGDANATAGNAATDPGPAWRANASVPEGAVVGERNATIDVRLERVPANASSGPNATGGANATTGNATAPNGTNASNASQGTIGSATEVVTTLSAGPDAATTPTSADRRPSPVSTTGPWARPVGVEVHEGGTADSR